MKKLKKKLSFDTFKIARLTKNSASIIGGNNNNTYTQQTYTTCPDTTQTLGPKQVSSLACASTTCPPQTSACPLGN